MPALWDTVIAAICRHCKSMPTAQQACPVTAPHLKLADLHGHAIVIHAGSDNYADEPKPLGGGGARIACGVVDNQ